MYRTLIIVIASVFMFQAAALKGTKEKTSVNHTLKELCKKRINAFSARDTNTLKKICTDNYRLIISEGGQLLLSQAIDYLAVAGIQMSSNTLLTFQSFLAEDESMAFSVAEIVEEHVDSNSVPVTNNLLVTEVYVNDFGKWKIQLTHISQKMCAFPQ